MRETKYHAYLDSEERTILLHSLVELKNQLIQQAKLSFLFMHEFKKRISDLLLLC